MSSEGRGGRAATTRGALEAALRAGRRALQLVAADGMDSYLVNEERQLAVERLLLRFGEALKAVPEDVLNAVDPAQDWIGPRRFRDLAAHWYTEGLDHRLIWRALRNELPQATNAIERFLQADEPSD
ncbi:HepT-like ribonuclease domain-containing protein [Phenylobacterium sp.]|uniref:HepT-like ribonuclease domain-containing protein n=1 Tax=Phenylobacterium sp. TaxID=1871053 RepID=UPI0025FFC270|nr:HepT-like ribonuclease domain-containing protein [Phenylobacterium sp.]MBX3483255.1 DUF86 domain-containing protein [Phenylobacterium sp.]